MSRDWIEITGISGWAYHGVLEEERRCGQLFSVDVRLGVDCEDAARSDDLGLTIDYSLVAKNVHEVLVGEPCNLIETVAQRVADLCGEIEGVYSAEVTVHKPAAPVGVNVTDVAVRIHREFRE